MMSMDAQQLFGAPNSIQRNSTNNTLELRWWRIGNPAEGEDSTVTELMVVIQPEELIEFISRLNADAWNAVRDIANDYAEGDCDTCGNRRLVDGVYRGRTTNRHCPDCRKAPRGAPFANRPRIRTGTWDSTVEFEN